MEVGRLSGVRDIAALAAFDLKSDCFPMIFTKMSDGS